MANISFIYASEEALLFIYIFAHSDVQDKPRGAMDSLGLGKASPSGLCGCKQVSSKLLHFFYFLNFSIIFLSIFIYF